MENESYGEFLSTLEGDEILDHFYSFKNEIDKFLGVLPIAFTVEELMAKFMPMYKTEGDKTGEPMDTYRKWVCEYIMESHPKYTQTDEQNFKRLDHMSREEIVASGEFLKAQGAAMMKEGDAMERFAKTISVN